MKRVQIIFKNLREADYHYKNILEDMKDKIESSDPKCKKIIFFKIEEEKVNIFKKILQKLNVLPIHYTRVKIEVTLTSKKAFKCPETDSSTKYYMLNSYETEHIENIINKELA